jgi:hypothetical protein
VQSKLISSAAGVLVIAYYVASSDTIDHPWLLAAVAVCSVPVYGLWAWLLFGSTTNALRACRWIFIRDSKSLFRGDYHEDKFSEVRLGALLGLSVLSVAAGYAGLQVVGRALFGA